MRAVQKNSVDVRRPEALEGAPDAGGRGGRAEIRRVHLGRDEHLLARHAGLRQRGRQRRLVVPPLRRLRGVEEAVAGREGRDQLALVDVGGAAEAQPRHPDRLAPAAPPQVDRLPGRRRGRWGNP